MNNLEFLFKSAARTNLIPIDDDIIADGSKHRCHIEGHSPGTKNGEYRLTISGNRAFGYAKNYKLSRYFSWNNFQSRGNSIAERLNMHAVIEQQKIDQENKRIEVMQHAQLWWSKAREADENNPYCQKKGIYPFGARTLITGVWGKLTNVLVVPMFDDKNILVNMQQIYPDGTKRFYPGGQKQNCFFIIPGDSSTIAIVEGFATGCTVHAQTGRETVIAFDAGNLENVAKIIRKRNLYSEILICGDNDLSGVGQKAARKAARAVGGKFMIPDEPGCDWNDVQAKTSFKR